MSVILKADNISKQYRLGNVGVGTLSDDIKRWWYKVRGKEDPFLQVGAMNKRDSFANEDYIWALKNISFEVKQGEVLGIIGKNGAGKSTLLKILSRVTSPTTGSIKTKGRIASLLEVGTGFHGELTGRENIFMNGAVLGMTRHEIKAKLDEIIAFSGCEKYIDTPVKRYSSGMTVRLGFAVAAHLEPEILVVDEVLAVGDADFQKKAIGKMQDLSKGEGRTVLFVSHNMASVNNLCTRGILLEYGKIAFEGDISSTISNYLHDVKTTSHLASIESRKGTGEISFSQVDIFGKSVGSKPISGEPLTFLFKIITKSDLIIEDIRFDMRIDDDYGQRLAWVSTSLLPSDYKIQSEEFQVLFNRNPFNKGRYYVTIYMEKGGDVVDWIDNAFYFDVGEGDFYNNGKLIPVKQSKVLLDFRINSL